MSVRFVPLIAFGLMLVVLAAGFFLEDPHKLPSVLIDRPFPEFSLPDLGSGDTLAKADVTGDVMLVNVWATWCPACLVEHPVLLRLAKEEGVPIVGVNYNDDPDKARVWLVRHENPYRNVLVDQQGELGIDLGIYGAPETFVVDAEGTIRYKHIGAVTEAVWAETLAPIFATLRGTP